MWRCCWTAALRRSSWGLDLQAVDCQGRTVLHVAVLRRRPQVIGILHMLLQTGGLNPAAVERFGKTAPDYCVDDDE